MAASDSQMSKRLNRLMSGEARQQEQYKYSDTRVLDGVYYDVYKHGDKKSLRLKCPICGEYGRLQKKVTKRTFGEHRTIRVVHSAGGEHTTYSCCSIGGNKSWFDVLWRIIERERKCQS